MKYRACVLELLPRRLSKIAEHDIACQIYTSLTTIAMCFASSVQDIIAVAEASV